MNLKTTKTRLEGGVFFFGGLSVLALIAGLLSVPTTRSGETIVLSTTSKVLFVTSGVFFLPLGLMAVWEFGKMLKLSFEMMIGKSEE